MKVLASLLFAMTVLFTSSETMAEIKTMSLATVDYPPYYGNKLENRGPIAEIIEAAFKQQGYSVNHKEMPWSRAIKSTKDGSFDALYTAWYRQDREEFFVFSDALPSNELVFFVRDGENIRFNGYDSLSDYKVGVVRDYATPPGFDEAKLKVQPGNSNKQNLDKLAAGRVDLVLIDRAQGKHIVRTELPQSVGKLVPIMPPASTETNHLIFSKAAGNAEEKAQIFNNGLKAITESGLLQEILEKHDF